MRQMTALDWTIGPRLLVYLYIWDCWWPMSSMTRHLVGQGEVMVNHLKTI